MIATSLEQDRKAPIDRADAQQRTAGPHGQQVAGQHTTSHGRPALKFHFERAICEDCPLFKRCVQSKVRGRTVTCDDYEPYRRVARQRQGTDEFKRLCRLRPKDERSQAELIGHGRRPTRYLGAVQRQFRGYGWLRV